VTIFLNLFLAGECQERSPRSFRLAHPGIDSLLNFALKMEPQFLLQVRLRLFAAQQIKKTVAQITEHGGTSCTLYNLGDGRNQLAPTVRLNFKLLLTSPVSSQNCLRELRFSALGS
jgi:hypothetical protein